jgi:hypothetical protein
VLHFVAKRISRRQNQNWHLGISPSNPAQNISTCEPWKHQVENDQIVLVGLGELPALFSILRNIDGKPLSRQAPTDESGDLLLVLDKQNSHISRDPLAITNQPNMNTT